MLECVVNIAEGRDQTKLTELARSCGDDLLDLHRDRHHHRSVFSVVGTDAPRRLASRAVELLDLRGHSGVHPRIGVVDVVPFVPLDGSTMADAVAARDAFSDWMGDELGVPCFRYGTERTLPEVRRGAFTTLAPDTGPPDPHPTAGACAVGAREVLVAYNVWVTAPDLAAVRRVATAVRSPTVRTLGLAVGDRFQVSCNLIAPDVTGPEAVTEAVRLHGPAEHVAVVGCELVGLVPRRVVERIDRLDLARLDLSTDRTIEFRLLAAEGLRR
jgi:glutamate formiminotransferase